MVFLYIFAAKMSYYDTPASADTPLTAVGDSELPVLGSLKIEYFNVISLCRALLSTSVLGLRGPIFAIYTLSSSFRAGVKAFWLISVSVIRDFSTVLYHLRCRMPAEFAQGEGITLIMETIHGG